MRVCSAAATGHVPRSKNATKPESPNINSFLDPRTTAKKTNAIYIYIYIYIYI